MSTRNDTAQLIKRLIRTETANLLPRNEVLVDRLKTTGATEGWVATVEDGVATWAAVPASGGGTAQFQVVTANTNTTITQADQVVLVTGAVTISLPASHTSGYWHEIKDASGIAGTTAITISGNGSNIDGAASVQITTNWGSMTVISDGADWFLI